MFDIVIVSEKPCWWLILTSSDFSDDIIVVNIPEDEHHYRNQVDINEQNVIVHIVHPDGFPYN